MRTETMGKVLVTAKVENLSDLFLVRLGQLTDDRVRRVEVTDALVDTGSTYLSLPKRLIVALGLQLVRTRNVRTVVDTGTLAMYDAVRLTIQGRDCTVDVAETDDSLPVLVGQVPLELLDWVVDAKGQHLIDNPAHGGEHMADMF